jgi:hypothetical protein
MLDAQITRVEMKIFQKVVAVVEAAKAAFPLAPSLGNSSLIGTQCWH